MPEAPATTIPAMASLHAGDDPAAPRKVVFGDAMDRSEDNFGGLRTAAVALAAEAAALRLRAAALETRATDLEGRAAALEGRATALEAETADIRADFAAADAGLQTQIDAKAPENSPALTGLPTAPTAAAGTNTPQIATTAYVTTAVSAAASGASSGDAALQAQIDGKAAKAGDTFTGPVLAPRFGIDDGAMNLDVIGATAVLTLDTADFFRLDRTNDAFQWFVANGFCFEVKQTQVLVPAGVTLRLNGPLLTPVMPGPHADNAAAAAAGVAAGQLYRDTTQTVRFRT